MRNHYKIKLFFRHWLKSAILLLGCFFAFTTVLAQNTISGKVSDAASGETLPGVNILIKGTVSGVVTDLDGNFSLEASPDDVLSISSVGFITQEITVGNQTSFQIALAEDIQALDEIVVIGYGVQKKKDATGSVAKIDSEEFNKGNLVSAQDLLVGRIAGVQITTDGGAPGSGATIRIRGGSSLSASNAPLFVIDGVIISDENVAGLRNPLSLLNPNDIDNVTVLKDASATAIYGARASNGVIIVTTKRGTEGLPLTVSYDGNVSVNSLPNKVEVFSGDDYRALVNNRIESGDPSVPAAAAALLGSADTDWQDQVFETAIGTDHNISVTGAMKNMPFRASVGYSNQDGILKNSNFQRTSLAIGLDPSFLDDHLSVKINARGSIAENQFSNQGAIGSAVTFDPTQPILQSGSPWGGYFFWPQSSDPLLPITIAPTNPVALIDLTDDHANVDAFIGNAQFDYKFHFLPELRANLNLAITRSKSEGMNIRSELLSNTFDPVNGNGSVTTYDEKKKNDLLEFYLNYAKDLEQINSRFDVLAGYSWQNFWREGSSVETNGAGNFERANSDFKSENFLISFFGRVNYTFHERYLLTFTLRRDGSSRFVGDNQWGTFPSAAFAWRIIDEPFLTNSSTFSDLKLRLGYGVTGQENIGNPYPALARVVFSDERSRYIFGTQPITTARLEGFDANLKWEETTTINAGLDFGFLEGRLSGSLDVYFRETEDLLNTIPVPIGTNFTNELLTNVGSLENKGVELSLNAIVIDKNDVTLDLGFNITANENEITKLTAVTDPNYLGVFTGGISGGVGTTIQIHSVGNPANSFFVYEQVYDESNTPIEGLYVDQNGDGIINDNDRVVFNDPAPAVYMGFSSRLSYQKLTFGFNARLNLDNHVYNNVSSQYGFYQNIYNSVGYTRNVPTNIGLADFTSPQYISDHYIRDASFFRMDNMTLGYNIGNVFSDKFDLNLNFTVQNAFVITDYDGLDPEINNGIDNNIFPRPRVFTLGVNLGFRRD